MILVTPSACNEVKLVIAEHVILNLMKLPSIRGHYPSKKPPPSMAKVSNRMQLRLVTFSKVCRCMREDYYHKCLQV